MFFFHGYAPNMKNYYSIDKLLKNVNVLPVGTGKYPTTSLYSDTKKWKFFEQKKCKNNKNKDMLLKVWQELIMLKF